MVLVEARGFVGRQTIVLVGGGVEGPDSESCRETRGGSSCPLPFNPRPPHLEVFTETGHQLHLDVQLTPPGPSLGLKLEEPLVVSYSKVEVPCLQRASGTSGSQRQSTELWAFGATGRGGQGETVRRLKVT